MAISTCSGCNLVFSTTAGFDMHRTGDYGAPIYAESGKGKRVIGHQKPTRRCMTPDEMKDRGMIFLPETGRWTTGRTVDFSWAHEKEDD
jgi:hypothetical protein